MTFFDPLNVVDTIFTGAAKNLEAGFNIIPDIDNLAKQTSELEKKIDTILNTVSTTLNSIEHFIQDLDTAISEIEKMLADLPSALVKALDANSAKSAFAKLKGHKANMSNYLTNASSLKENAERIQNLCQSITDDIEAIDTFSPNGFQFIAQAVPGLSLWVQGYTSYNLLRQPDKRDQNPWDADLVANTSLPKFNDTLKLIKDQKGQAVSDLSQLPLEGGVVYAFDGQGSFSRTQRHFMVTYPPGTIDSMFYYTIWPEGVQWNPPVLIGPAPGGPPSPGGAAPPGFPMPTAGDFCYLTGTGFAQRSWGLPPPRIAAAAGVPPFFPEVAAAMVAAAAYPRTLASALRSRAAFDQLTNGWQLFEQATNQYLAKGYRDLWTKIPQLT
jgi:hypothetical protein